MELICEQCNKNFFSYFKTQRFCSKSCYSIWQKGKPAYPNLVGKRGTKPRGFKKTPRDKYGSVEDIEWRTFVFQRDKYTCQECKQVGGRLEAHHIKAFKKYPDLRLDINNGLTLCKECHKKTDTYGWANYWKSQIAEARINHALSSLDTNKE